MDPVTQGLLGGVLAGAIQPASKIRARVALGVLGGLAPDLDVLISSDADPLLSLVYHRHFTHSLVFIPITGLVVAGLLYFYFKRWLTFRECFFAAMIGGATHGLLDACTSYGTQLLWPFADTRIAWNCISIVDLVFSGALFVGFLIAVRQKKRKPLILSTLFCLCYLLFGVYQRGAAEQYLSQHAKSIGHKVEAHQVKPTLGNLVLWRLVYKSNNTLYTAALRQFPGLQTIFYKGESIPAFRLEKSFPELSEGLRLAQDIRRFMHFSGGFVSEEMRGDFTTLWDMRYSIQPNTVYPLWGIGFRPKSVHSPVFLVSKRDLRKLRQESFEIYLRMFRGQPLEESG